MKLAIRFSILLGAAAVALIAFMALLSHFVLHQQARAMDRQVMFDTLDRGRRVLESERDGLGRFVIDRSSWDDTYDFMWARNPDYLKINMGDDSCRALWINLVALGDTNGAVVFSKAYDLQENAPAPVPEDVLRTLLNAAGGAAVTNVCAGFVAVRERMWLAAAAPILHNDDSGPSRGVLLLARWISEAEFKRLGNEIHPSLRLTALAAGGVAEDTARVGGDDRLLCGRIGVPGFGPAGAVALEVAVPRTAYRSACRYTFFLLGFILVGGLLLAVVTHRFLRGWVIHPLEVSVEAIRAGVAAYGASGGRLLPGKAGAVELRRLGECINAMLDVIEESRRRSDEALRLQHLATLGTLVAAVAHEVNNPNGSIALNMGALRRCLRQGEPCPEADDIMEDTLDASRRIAAIVTALKTISRPLPARFNTCVDINDLVRRSVDAALGGESAVRAAMVIDLAQDVPPVAGDAGQLQQVLVNIIQNAHAALRPGGRLWTTTSRAGDDGRTARIVVRDEGVGIRPEDIPFVKRPFFTTRRALGGTGLGLFIAENIVQVHGGALRLQSVPGVGTTVTIDLSSGGGCR